jgi:hypothetical protein
MAFALPDKAYPLAAPSELTLKDPSGFRKNP